MNVILDISCIKNFEKYQTNIENLYEGKGELFQKALGVPFEQLAESSKPEENATVSFPYFKSVLNKKELLSYIQLAQSVSSIAKNNRTISQKKNDNQNDKFMMRTQLGKVRLKQQRLKVWK